MSTQYKVITPAGGITVTWADDEDALPVYEGAGVDYFRNFLDIEMVTGTGGRRLTMNGMEPADLYGFCQSDAYAIKVLPNPEDLMEEAGEEAAPALDSVSPLERVKLTAELAAKSKAIPDAKAIERVKLAKAIGDLIVKLGGDAEQEEPTGELSDDGLSDDPNAPNYRYKDTGYIADSRKERAANQIKVAREAGQMLRATDVDWDAVEQNPRVAKELIVKSNLFGRVDWASLQGNGMEPGAGFLIDRIYASIAPEPAGDNPQARKDYALGIETIRARLERCKTTDDVLAVLGEIKDELNGASLNEKESAAYEEVQAQIVALGARYRELSDQREVLAKAYTAALGDYRSADWDQQKRLRRGWKADPELQKIIDAAKVKYEAAQAELMAWDESHPEMKTGTTSRITRDEDGNIISSEADFSSGIRDQMSALYKQRELIERGAKIRNVVENPVTRAWLTFGERFFKLLHYRSYKGSDTFAGHVTNAKAGRVKDWSWAEKERTVVKTATKQEVNFQLRVADTFERVGGKPVSVSSTADLKSKFGFREVQSGNWVLKDPLSAKFHVEQTAAAMTDLGDILGIDPALLGLGGRLGMAFGARGSGNAGWKGAARAHYEPVHRVINLTKMGGGGALGHEWAHCFDNLIPELAKQEASSSKKDFVSENLSLLPEGPLRAGYAAVMDAMTRGERRATINIDFTDKDRATAKYNLDRSYVNAVGKLILAAGNAQDAALAVMKYFAGREDKKGIKMMSDWRKIAVAYYAPEGETSLALPVGPKRSEFVHGAIQLDGGEMGKYWSARDELFARAFQAYLEDRLADQGRKNDYLSVYADNKYHVDPLLGIEWKPYPEGEERSRINAAFDKLFSAVRDAKVFESAVANKALMDSIFGNPLDEAREIIARLNEGADEDREVLIERLADLLPMVEIEDEEERAAFEEAAAQAVGSV